MNIKKQYILPLILVVVLLTSCSQSNLEVDNDSSNSEISNPNIKEMQISKQDGITDREKLILSSLHLSDANFYDYKVDSSIKSLQIYVLQATKSGKWKKKIIAKQDITSSSSSFFTASDVNQMKVYLGFKDDELDQSGIIDIKGNKNTSSISSTHLSEISDIKANTLIPLSMVWNSDVDMDKIEAIFQKNENNSIIESMYRDPQQVKETLGLDNHFMITVAFSTK